MSQAAGKFAHCNRITSASEYRNIFRSHCSSKDNWFVIIASENGLNYARLGLALSKTRANRAVTRNRLKRLIRESFRTNQHLLTGLDVVVMINRKPGNCSNSTIYKSLQMHWQKLDKCRPSQSN